MSSERRPKGCNRTRGLLERIVDDRVSAEDLAHAHSCSDCGPVIARAARFDEELRRAAQGLVVDEMPSGVLDPGLSPTVVGAATAPRAAPSMAGLFAAVAVLVVASALAFVPGGLGRPTPAPTTGAVTSVPPPTLAAPTGPTYRSPALRSTAEIGGQLIGLQYLCQAGRERPPAVGDEAPVVRDGIVCYSPKLLTLTSVVVITGESAERRVIEVAIKGSLVGEDTEAARSELAETMAKATFMVIVDSEEAPRAGDFVLAQLPALRAEAGGVAASATFGDVNLRLQRSPDGSYFLLLQSSQPS